jgi:DNA-binding Lrp family transcriptional regulator
METTLDRIDFELLGLLQKDARLTNKELAAAVDLAPSSCLARVQRLKASGTLLGFHADVSPHAVGVGLQALIAVQLQKHSRSRVRSFWRHALGLNEVLAVYHVAGEFDFQVHVAVRDSDHLRDLALDAFTTREEVARIATSLIFETAKKSVLPNYTASGAASATPGPRSSARRTTKA